jgi:enoyl-CoA hydratase
MGEALVACELAGPVAWLRLNRPDAMNALSTELLDDLDHAIDIVERDTTVRVVVLTGTGHAFCAGVDLKEIGQPPDPDRIVAFVRAAGATIDRLPALGKPVIAAVNGLALAGGLELVLACDLVVAAASARLGDAHANYGLLPGAGGAVRLARVVGPTVAKYLAFTGQSLPAADLVPLGLVNEVVPPGRLRTRANELAQQIAAKSPQGIARMKALIRDGLDQPLDTALRLERLVLATHAHSADLVEGLAAFTEKRLPRYPGR